MREASSKQRGRTGERKFRTPFSSYLKKMPTKERDVRKMIAEVEATIWRLRECIRVRELAATHRLERIRHLRMLEEQEA